MSFYIYENWVAEKKAVIHKGTCRFCNNGVGIQEKIHGNKNGMWHGPFDTFEEANARARSLRDRTIRTCSRCKPHD